MSAIHELDQTLTASVPAQISTVRIPAAEVHLNPWLTGTKGAPSITIGSRDNLAAAGIQLVAQRLTPMSNAPSELILGDLSGSWVLNLADIEVLTSNVSNISTVYML